MDQARIAWSFTSLLHSIPTKALQGGNHYHVHYREAKGLAKATQLAREGARPLARPRHVLSVPLPVYSRL